MLKWLEHPITRNMDLDDPETTLLRKQIIQKKKFLKNIYEEWYRMITSDISSIDEHILELGSGAGFLDEYIPGVITSELLFTRQISCVLDGQKLPFSKNSLGAVVMVDVLHHIPNCDLFFDEIDRCVKPGGVVSMIEPWATKWSSMIYKYLHPEPFDADIDRWDFPSTGPLSGANGALPWIVFCRDRQIFMQRHPKWMIYRIRPIMPFLYLASGGISTSHSMPGWSFPIFQFFESCLKKMNNHLSMFAHITLKKQ